MGAELATQLQNLVGSLLRQQQAQAAAIEGLQETVKRQTEALNERFERMELAMAKVLMLQMSERNASTGKKRTALSEGES